MEPGQYLILNNDDMTIEDVLFFDTETTGIPDRSAKWDVDFMQYPHVVQMAWIHGCKVESHIIRPDGWEIPDETVEIHGITNEYAREHGEPFAAKIAADASKKFGAFAETVKNGPISQEIQKDDKLPVQAEKAPQIKNLNKITDAAVELLEQNNF